MAREGKYEVIFILDPEAGDVNAVKAEAEQTIEKRSGKISEKEEWGRRKLFHPPKHKTDGIFHYVKMTAPTSSIAQMVADFNVNTGIMKSMVARIY